MDMENNRYFHLKWFLSFRGKTRPDSASMRLVHCEGRRVELSNFDTVTCIAEKLSSGHGNSANATARVELVRMLYTYYNVCRARRKWKFFAVAYR